MNTNAPRARYATVKPTPLIESFADWIEREVGVKLTADQRYAIYLGSSLRAEFQKANRSAPKAATPKARKPLPLTSPAKSKAVRTTTQKEAAK